MDARLFVIPGSHPSMAARLMLEAKGIPYTRTDLMPVISKAVLRAARFPGATVPALKIDGRRIQGSREIARELDRIRPDPPLVPSDPERRAAVEEAERWGDIDLQPMVRRILWNAVRRQGSSIATYAEGARLGIPVSVAARTSAPIIWASVRLNKAGDEAVRHDLAALPGALERADDYIADGTLGDEPPTAADYQVATSIRLAMTLDDLRDVIERRPCGELALRIAPDFPGRVGAALPGPWLEPLRESTPAAA